jgi:2-keto-4-pentenoate hydratase/2-oxohepta-3-ene-1,7-dioic acid hydratase in catechol pathway
MRIVSIRKGYLFRLGAMSGDSALDLMDLASESGRSAPFLASMALFLEAGAEAQDFVAKLLTDGRGSSQGKPTKSVDLGPPVPKPGKIIAVGLNYKEHAGEGEFQLPEAPLLFAKFPNAISGPQDAIAFRSEDMQVDSEAELAVVIGRRAKAISPESGYEYVAGYMALNDVSARKWQFADKQWTRGKSCDTFCPTGPWLTTRDEIPDPHNLWIEGRLNSQVMQRSNTCHLIFPIPELLSYISDAITLEAGDIIATGTPSGVGIFRKPPILLKDGDITEVEIEKLGTLRNEVRVSAHP